VRAAQQLPPAQPAPKPRLVGPARRIPKPRKKARPTSVGGDLQDEWGIYDPAVCGFDALFDKLDGGGAPPSAQEAPSAGELLMRAGRGGEAAQAARGQRGPRPLAIWARRHVEEAAGPATANGRSTDSAVAVMGGLLLPPAIAAVRYAGGCRIRRVKVKASTKRHRRVPNAPVIILSKRLLEQVRPRGNSGSSVEARTTAA
jgi:hypothetical protein